ncbi:MAG: class I SAM-dependent DNA methyltransferase [Parvibaculum sp.]|jgi:type II restriction/modification system DNA methylase subunit YeeA|nr:class I SAM-dependent DNA methyltransferase [Parvibaculum sp.]
MTPEEFVAKWKASTLTERAASQSQFNDLCRMLGEPTPTEADPSGATYAFEKGASKATGAGGWADVWKQGFFAWEYKGKGKDLNAAFAQLQQYSGALGNPPLLVVSDMAQFRVTTAWTNTVSKTYDLTLDDLLDPAKRQILKWVFSDPEKLKPGQTRQALTEDAAKEFANLALRLRSRGHDPHVVAHFVNRLVFCMFAEDAELLPNKMFQRMVEASLTEPERFEPMAGQLFGAMKSGGLVGFETVEWFNGGLFDDDSALPLERDDLKNVLAASRLDWTEIDPSILGTLFERGLDPDKRSQLGAHYTDREKILRIIEPVITKPLLAEWAAVKPEIETLLEKSEEIAKKASATRAAAKAGALTKQRNALRGEAESKFRSFLERLRAFRVLDPACGSGNFLYLSLLALKDLELQISIEGEALGLERQFPSIGPECLLGIEINPYAAELARVSVWIGELQWMKRNGFGARKNPILINLNTIENRDAVVNGDGTEACWPPADVIVGNPPFLGAKLMKRRLGVVETEALRRAYQGRLAGFTDLVCYWFEKARAQVSSNLTQRVGLVATSSIRGGTNRPVLDRIHSEHCIYDAWSALPWTIEGARVEVSLICFSRKGTKLPVHLDGEPVRQINPDLTTGLNLTTAQPLPENRNVSFLGIQKSGPHDVEGVIARQWMSLPMNPNNRPNSEILKPYWNGDDVTGRPRDVWIIDFPAGLSRMEASLYEAPFHYLESSPYDPDDPTDTRTLVEARAQARDKHAQTRWWEPYWPRPDMRGHVARLSRYIVTTETSEHRLFVWLSYPELADKNLIVIARDDDTTFGILHSRFHESWSLRLGTSLEDRPRYTSTTTFSTFPFPEGLTPSLPTSDYANAPNAIAIGKAAKKLDELRRAWLNPPDLVKVVPEVVPGFPDRILPKDEEAAKVLKGRTLTNLYNQRPAWLEHAHKELDAAVAAAYGWPKNISDDDALEALLELNRARAG